ncbi:MAG TPA: hypothetical protein VK862_01650, partial [Afifellaceae bacterium]|nr:hypothetical protein [Afifellaceae bacterium]
RCGITPFRRAPEGGARAGTGLRQGGRRGAARRPGLGGGCGRDFTDGARLCRGAGGHLLVVDHASRLPWSSAPSDWVYPTAEKTLAAFDLREREWARIHVGEIERTATGPDGEAAIVRDSVVFLGRL